MTEKKDKLLDPKDIEIKLSFVNYKLLKKAEFNLQGSYVYFVKGPNETGKSTILQALKAVQEVKDDTHRKVSIGETEGVNQFTIPGPGNKIYNISYEFTDASTRFVVFDQDGNKISKITEIRDIFKYNHIDASSFMALSHTAEGRRKQKEHILRLLPPEQLLRYNELENDEKGVFDERTAVKRDLDLQEKLVTEYTLKPEEKEIALNLNKAETLLSNKKDRLSEIDTSNNPKVNELKSDITTLSNTIAFNNSELINIESEIKRLQEKQKQLENDTDVKQREFVKEKAELEKLNSPENIKECEELKESIDKGQVYVDKARIYNDHLIKFNNANEKRDVLKTGVENLTKNIETFRKEKEEIITKGNFPVDNISFDEDGYLTINDLRFDENQTCESDAILLIAQIMCRINETPIQVLGDASLLDFNKLDKLYDIAKENGKIMFVDEVDRGATNLAIVGYERHTKEKITDKKTANSKKPDENSDLKTNTNTNLF